MTQFNFEAIGTKWQIDIFDLLSSFEEESILQKIKSRIDIFDKTYSRFRPDSLVTEISGKPGDYVFPEDAKELFKIYFDLYKKTDGYFTPLVGNLLSDAGYDAKYSLEQKKELVRPGKWEDFLEYKYPVLSVKKPVILDFGAGGKGYLVDIISKLLEENNIKRYCVDAGGDIFQKNTESLRVGLQNPFNTEEVIGVCNLRDQSICGSAGTYRAWGEFTHIMNPKTLSSPQDIAALWVVASSALIADSIATCLFFVEPDLLSEDYCFEYVILKSDMSVIKSEKFPGEFFLKNNP